MSHWGPHNPNGNKCRFCSDPPFPPLRNSRDVQDYCACFDARWPPLYTKLRGVLYELDRNVCALR